MDKLTAFLTDWTCKRNERNKRRVSGFEGEKHGMGLKMKGTGSVEGGPRGRCFSSWDCGSLVEVWESI